MSVQPFDIAAVIVAIIGAFAAVYRPSKKQPPGEDVDTHKRRPLDKQTLIRGAGAGVLLLCAVYLGWRYWPRTAELKILSPHSGATVSMQEFVSGTSRNTEGHHIWLVVYSGDANRYYPQMDPPRVEQNGDWESRAYVGNEKDAGKKFEIFAVLLGDDGQREFQAYLERGDQTGTWDGIDKLPSVITTDRISVTRQQ